MDTSKLTTEVLSGVLEFVKASGSFVKEQAPLLAQEIIKYEIVSSLVCIIVLSLLFLFLIFIGVKCVTTWDDCECGGVVSFLVSAGLVVIICCMSTALIKAVTAPRLVVIEQISHMIKYGGE